MIHVTRIISPDRCFGAFSLTAKAEPIELLNLPEVVWVELFSFGGMSAGESKPYSVR